MCTPVLSVRKLARLLHDVIDGADILPLLAQLAETRDPAAIRVIATVLDTPGAIGSAAVQALIGFGAAAIPCMRACLDAIDEDTIRNAHRVLAALGDVDSARAQHAHCWADLAFDDAPPVTEIVAHFLGRNAA